jgi:hypothetical protein
VNVATALTKALRKKVVINENGRRRTVTKVEAAVKQLVNKAAGGDPISVWGSPMEEVSGCIIQSARRLTMDYPEKVKQAFANKTDDLGVVAAADTEVPPVEHGDRWGNWQLTLNASCSSIPKRDHGNVMRLIWRA